MPVPRPLGTVRASFPAHGSSTSKGCDTRWLTAKVAKTGRPLYTSNEPPSRYALAAGRLRRRAIPLFAAAEGAPAGRPAVICVPSAYRFIKLSCDQAPDGRQRRFRPGHRPYPLHYRAAFASSILPPAHPQQRPSRVACPLPGRRYAGYRVPRNYPRSLGLTRTPVAQHLRWRTLDPPSLATYLLVQATSTLGLFSMTALQ